jgi:hypothetical protein
MISSRYLLNAAFIAMTACLPIRAIAASAAAGQPSLTVVNAGVESEEDGPFAPADYAFLPGQYVYFSFQISGYKVKGDEYNGPRSMSVSYKIELLDAKNVLLTKAEQEQIEQEIGTEDKDWLPKRRFAALLPPLIGAGTYHIHLVLTDLLDKSQAVRDFPFVLGGKRVDSTGGLAIQDFRFLRSDQDGPGLEIAAFQPGDTVWARFDMTGFKVGPGNSVNLNYGLSVLRPDGTVLFKQENAAQQKFASSAYPPQFVPGVLSVSTTSDLQRGEYTMVISVRDNVGQTTTQIRKEFRIE